MMRNILYAVLLMGIIGLYTQCQQPKNAKSSSNEAVVNQEDDRPADTAMYATLESISDSPRLNGSLMIRFTVTNPTKDTLKFTDYNTPFEGLKSKFLTVREGKEKEVDYLGPMVKRVMPPPANTYHILIPGQSESVTFDLKKCYKIENAGTYTLQYNGEKISGISNGKAITIIVLK